MTKKNLATIFIILMIFGWSSIYYLGYDNLSYARDFASLNLMKPFVYRQLPMVLARLLELIGVRIDLGIVLVMTSAGVGFYYALRELAFLFYKQNDKIEIAIIALVCIGLILFGDYRKPYDLFTAWLFTLAFLYLAQARYGEFVIVFALACLNRETAFLLIVFTAVIMVLRGTKEDTIRMLFIQSSIFGIIQIQLHFMFRDNAGSSALIEPIKNMAEFVVHPFITMLHLSILALVLWVACKDWIYKPRFLRLALITLSPPLMLMYLVFGQAFEVRVFWEVYPIIVVLSLPSVVQSFTWIHSLFLTIRVRQARTSKPLSPTDGPVQNK